METKKYLRKIKSKPAVIFVGVTTFLIAACLIGLGAYRLVTGKSVGLRSFITNQISAVKNLGKVILDSSNVKNSAEDFKNIVFLHHSTGNNLLGEGGVRKIFQNAGYDFWDHGYNRQGLRGPDGKVKGYNYRIPDDNTDPDGFYKIFTQPEYPLPINAYSGLLQHDVIIFKSCFGPGNQIKSDAQLEQYKEWYLAIRDEIDQHPEKIFIILTIPPLNPAETNQEEAVRARAFSEWLISEEFLAGHPNLFTFNFFDALAESDPDSPEYNMLRADYRIGADSHPNEVANQTIGPSFAAFIISAIDEYKDLVKK